MNLSFVKAHDINENMDRVYHTGQYEGPIHK